ncbi:MAG TPA: alpha/beta hydrolase fold domain-containing protein [Solirubrobacterales bacterium]|nr:alpha/beta hydrolase fold domain-containing protein [Solirubrobacterales bacterium]
MDVPRPVGKLLTRIFQRGPHRPWIPLDVRRRIQDAAARLTRIPPGVTITPEELGGVRGDRLQPDRAEAGRAILYLHGGAYVGGSPRTHRGLAAQIALAGSAPVHLIDYRLAPEHPHPAAVEDALAAYRGLLDSDRDPQSIVVAGDSAGAGLGLALAQRLRDGAGPLPGGLVLLNGWLDLALTGPSLEFNRRRDVGLAVTHLAESAEWYRGTTEPGDPELSPIHADLTGLPPMYLQCGTDDILLSDSERLAESAREAGIDVAFSRYEGMWHDFQLGAGMNPQADAAIADLGQMLRRIWAGEPLADPDGPAIGGSNGHRTPTVAIIGAGFGGVGLGISLKRAGIDSFTIFEKADGVGGVWRDNTYPGLTCDIPSHLYSFSFEPNPDWSRTYSPQPEILAYLERCVAKYGLDPNLRLGSEVARADFDAESGKWKVITAAGETSEFDVVVSSCGQLSRPALARIPGADRFEGPIFHTARWDHSVELDGKRVAVIGTGASTVQVVPAIAPEVGRLDVYQRSAPYVIPKKDRPYRGWERRLFRSFPPARLAVRFGQWLQFELFSSAFTRFRPLGKAAVRMAEKNLEQQVSDADLLRAFTPEDVIGCKRVLVSSEYYATFERPNVELVPHAVIELTEDGVLAEDGVERKTDVVVLSTGFESHSFLAPMEVRGRDGRELSEVWRHGANAYLGMTVAGFPNLFVMYGPNTNLGAGSIITQLESQMAYILDAVLRLRTTGGWLSVKPEVQESFDRTIQERLADSVWVTGCNNWYVDENGRDTNNWPGFTLEYRWRTRRLDPSDYEEAHLSTSGL